MYWIYLNARSHFDTTETHTDIAEDNSGMLDIYKINNNQKCTVP